MGDDPNKLGNLSKTEGAIIVAIASLVILAGTQIAINSKIIMSVDFAKNEELATKIVDNNNTLFSQLTAASFVFLGIGGGTAATFATARMMQNRAKETKGPPGD